MKNLVLLVACCFLVIVCFDAQAAPTVGGAPKGDPKIVSEKIIRANFPKKCKSVTRAERLPDGTIAAVCKGVTYRVFTMYNPEEGKLDEIALNCDEAAKLGVSCF